jgi:ESF2/ABP1 family protein
MEPPILSSKSQSKKRNRDHNDQLINNQQTNEIVMNMNEDDNNLEPTLQATSNNTNNTKSKPGVVYISRIPPGINPGGIKSLLMEHAPIVRIYLQPDDDSMKRKRNQQNGIQYFVEGWVEFESKKDAKRVANLLNGTRMGPKKGRRFYDDLWSLKYLSGFTWAHLTEKSIRERKQREQLLRLEFAQAKKDDELYLQQLKKNKMVKLMQADKKHDSMATIRLKEKAEENIKQIEPVIHHSNKRIKQDIDL